MAAIDTSTIQLLLETGAKIKAQELKQLPNDPERHILFSEGEHTILETPRRNTKRNHRVATIADFVLAYEALLSPAEEGEPERPTPSPIWFDQTTVIVFVDDRFRDEGIRLDLPKSDELLLVEQWADGATLDQPTFVRKLRHDLAACVEKSVLAAFRSMNWQTLQNTKRLIEQNRQSIDADVQQTAIGADRPEEFAIDLPLFDHPDFRQDRATVRVTIDLVFERSSFLVQIRPGDLSAANERAREAIRAALVSVLPEATIIAGSP